MSDAYGAPQFTPDAIITAPLAFTFVPPGVDPGQAFVSPQVATPGMARPANRNTLLIAGGIAALALVLAMSSPGGRRR